ncbi:MAG: hypothetical protein AAF184_14055 [Pseudomonadota bacterium]
MVWFDPFVVPFHYFVVAHILTGSVGLLGFWGPILTRKGAAAHRQTGRVFTLSMLITGTFAICMSICTILDPVTTHPHVHESAELIRGIFGWMMLYLAILTINLAWYGWLCILNRKQRDANRGPINLTLQGVLLVAAVNCAWQGWLLRQPLMLGISTIGFATVATNLWFLYKPRPSAIDWLLEHIKALVGAGISVYTAFFAFGAVRLMPELALNPLFWSIPLVIGLGLILFHWRRVIVSHRRGRAQRRPVRQSASAPDVPLAT